MFIYWLLCGLFIIYLLLGKDIKELDPLIQSLNQELNINIKLDTLTIYLLGFIFGFVIFPILLCFKLKRYLK